MGALPQLTEEPVHDGIVAQRERGHDLRTVAGLGHLLDDIGAVGDGRVEDHGVRARVLQLERVGAHLTVGQLVSDGCCQRALAAKAPEAAVHALEATLAVLVVLIEDGDFAGPQLVDGVTDKEVALVAVVGVGDEHVAKLVL